MYQSDVAECLRHNSYNAILLDVDNGPGAFTKADNNFLYSRGGLQIAHAALHPQGTYAVWSAFQDPRFLKNMQRAGFAAECRKTRAREQKGSPHFIYVGRKG